MRDGVLSYNGATYRLPGSVVADLLARSVIVRDCITRDAYELSRDHAIDEIEALATVLDRRSGAEARGEVPDEGLRRMIAVRYMHRDGQGRG